MKVNVELNTSGKGLWSKVSRPVTVTRLEVPYVAEDFSFGELRAYFDEGSWEVSRDGLIYTDPEFLKGLLKFLRFLFDPSLTEEDVNYSEQGMQGRDYVSLDVEEKFIKGWIDFWVENPLRRHPSETRLVD